MSVEILTYKAKTHFEEIFELHVLFLNGLAELRNDISKKVLDKQREEECFKASLEIKNTDCFVITVNGEVVGYSVSYPCKTTDPLHYAERKFAFLDEIFIKADYRKQGLATKLIAHLKEHYKNKGIKTMELYLLANNTSAYNTYIKNGFSAQSMRMEIGL